MVAHRLAAIVRGSLRALGLAPPSHVEVDPSLGDSLSGFEDVTDDELAAFADRTCAGLDERTRAELARSAQRATQDAQLARELASRLVRLTATSWAAQSSLALEDETRGMLHTCPLGRVLVVGPSPDADIEVPGASERHCELRARGGGRLEVRAASLTLLNGVPIAGRATARSGDRLGIGAHVLAVRDLGELSPDSRLPTMAGRASELAPGESLATLAPAWTRETIANPAKPLEPTPPSLSLLPRGPQTTIAGRYRLVREIGRGGAGSVYEGEDLVQKKRCAVKCLHPHVRADAVLVERFKREALVGRDLGRHPGIVATTDVGSEAGELYLVMEYVDGSPLDALVRAKRPRAELLRLVSETARAVAFAHERRVIHRDLKPQNVLVEKGRSRLTDFGLAKVLDDTGLTDTGSLLGTPAFMSPEQILEPKRVGVATDIYALGAILYAVLVGHAPYRERDLRTLLSKVQLGDHKPARELDASIDPRLDALCRKAMSVELRKRPASATAFADELDRLI